LSLKKDNVYLLALHFWAEFGQNPAHQTGPAYIAVARMPLEAGDFTFYH